MREKFVSNSRIFRTNTNSHIQRPMPATAYQIKYRIDRHQFQFKQKFNGLSIKNYQIISIYNWLEVFISSFDLYRSRSALPTKIYRSFFFLNFNWCYTLLIFIQLLNAMCMFFFECPLAIQLIVSQSNVCFYSINYFNLFWWSFLPFFDFSLIVFFHCFSIWSLNVFWLVALATSAKSTKEA